jgi:uncharacterized membrane protein
MATAAVSTSPVDGIVYAPPKRQRVDSIDLLRGLVMVIMMLDHTRDFFHSGAFQFDPTDLTKTSVPLFLTRWVTHFCAPVFFFLAGTGAYLRQTRGTTPRELSWFLVSRGLWLVVLELTLVRIGITFQILPHGFYFVQTIWALGWSMIALAALVHLPLAVTGGLGALMILVHNAFDGFQVGPWSPGQPDRPLADKLLAVFHQPVLVPVTERGPVVLTQYPLIPWLGVMAVGYAFGRLYTMDQAERRRILIRLGGAVIAFFVVLRATNLYGDASKWAVQKHAAFSVLSFLNATKYPPSLLYLCMTLGPAILLLAFLERERRGRLGRVLVTFGRVPFLFYMLQWYVAHTMAFAAFAAAGKPVAPLFYFRQPPATPQEIAQAGFSLGVVYLFWLLGLVIVYPLCARYAEVKKRRNDWWLGYL